MEHVTMVVAITYAGGETKSEPDWLLIGHKKVPVAGRTIAQCLGEMYGQGWSLTKSRATADHHGIVCEYEFEREPTSVAPDTAAPCRLTNSL